MSAGSVTYVFNWFYNPQETFTMWDLTHILTIIFILFIYIVIFIFRFQLKPYRKQIRLFIGSLLILIRLSLYIWYVLTGTWSVQHALLIELCSIAFIGRAH